MMKKCLRMFRNSIYDDTFYDFLEYERPKGSDDVRKGSIMQPALVDA